MKLNILIFVLSLSVISVLDAQITRSELEKETTKGISLLKNGKLEEAISVFNDILQKDPTEGKALLLRARTKYELGAYKGSKKDCFAYMDVYGIDEEVAGLLGKNEKALENYKQALAYLKTAILFDPDGIEYLMDRADIFYNLGLDEQACEDWNRAKSNGSEAAKRLSDDNCKKFNKPASKPKKTEVVKEDKEMNPEESDIDSEEDTTNDPPILEEDKETDYTQNNSTDIDSEESSDDDTESDNLPSSDISEEADSTTTDTVVEEVEEAYPIDDKIEEIFIDEELTIIISNGLGSRKVTEVPDILILSDKSGEVVVNVCVDRLGRVQEPILNEELSTIKTKSLVSLALRESSNFRFARSTRKNHCGTITFMIVGSE